MPTHVTPNVRPTDDLADQFKRVLQRLASLERAASSSATVAKLPRGYVARAVQPGPQSGIGTVDTDITGCTVTWTADPTRRYRLSARITVQKIASAGDMYAHITDAANTKLIGALVTGVVNAWQPLYVDTVQSGLSGSQTRKLRCITTAGTMSTAGTAPEYGGYIFVEDIGGV